MKEKMSLQAYKGTRDFYPAECAQLIKFFDLCRESASLFAFEEYMGPLLESFDLYAAKTGQEIVEKQLYHFLDRGERKVAIRPEMTPTMARMIAAKFTEIKQPIRWFSIPNLYRYERPQRGRLREHWQFNADLLGGDEEKADIEILCLLAHFFQNLGALNKIKIRVNNRKIVQALLNQLGTDEENSLALMKLIDAKEKLSAEAFDQKLKIILPEHQQQKLLDEYFQGSFESETLREDLEKNISVIQKNYPGLDIFYDPIIMRGLDYYTGMVFEVFDSSPENNRALAGGGRYDHLLNIFGKNSLSGVGFGMGDVGILNFIETHQLFKETNKKSVYFITLKDESNFVLQQKLATALRKEKISALLSLKTASLSKQIAIARAKNASDIVVFEENEKITVKNLETSQEKTFFVDEFIKNIQK